MTAALEVRGVSKTFRRWWSRREVRALRNVSFGVQPGTIFGLLGPNGAGKTTLVKIALTIAYPDDGEIRVLGESVRNRSVLRRVGYLPENPRFPTHLTAWQVLRLYGSLSGADISHVDENAAKWLDRLDLGGWRDVRVSKFSKGMNERLALAQALVHDPEFIFLDEPTDGLDPLGRRILIFSPVLAAHEQITPAFSSELYRRIFRTFYWVLPKSAETIGAMRRLIMERPLELNWVMGTSFTFALVCYIGTVVYFTRKDY